MKFYIKSNANYSSYRHYVLVNRLEDCLETYEQYLRETDSGSTPEWLIRETAKRTYNYRFINNDVMI